MLRVYKLLRYDIKYPFDAVYYINLESRKDRLKHIKTILEELSFQDRLPRGCVERIEAIDGQKLNIQKLHQIGQLTSQALDRYKKIPLADKFYGMDLTDGALGCALSHRNVWRKIVSRNNTCALVLEDDVELSPEFPLLISSRLSTVPANWEMLYLGGVDLLSAGKPPRPMIAPGWRRAYTGQRELTAYVLNTRGAQICLDLTHSLNWQIDTHICEITQDDFDHSRPYLGRTQTRTEEPFRPDTHSAMDRFISKPMSYVLHPTLAIQLSKFGTNVQKFSETATGDAHAIDAKRRIREFFAGLTSVR